MKAIKSNLKDLTEQEGEFLYCPICNSEYSACRGDYFLLPEDPKFTCCGMTMIIARKEIKIVEV